MVSGHNEAGKTLFHGQAFAPEIMKLRETAKTIYSIIKDADTYKNFGEEYLASPASKGLTQK